jgi:hypothetical protein
MWIAEYHVGFWHERPSIIEAASVGGPSRVRRRCAAERRPGSSSK